MGVAMPMNFLGDITNAEKDYREALSYNPDHEGSRQGIMRIQRANSQTLAN